MLAGPGISGWRAVRVFHAVESAPITAETAAAATHAMSHRRRVGCRAARSPQPVATAPIRISPQPENAENEETLSMVSRMKRRSAMARAWRAGDSEIGWFPMAASSQAIACGDSICQVL